MKHIPSLADAVYGLAVGDALGVPVEFCRRGEFHIQGMEGHGTFDFPAGTWSDDTSLTLATCDSIRRRGCIDIADLRQRFCQWLFRGAYTPFGKTFGVGMTTRAALVSGEGQRSDLSNGNGSLMRILPLAFTEASDDDVRAVSAITHAHLLSMDACVSLVRIAKEIKKGSEIDEAVSREAERGPFKELAGLTLRKEEEIPSSGFVMHTLQAALWCNLTSDSYEEAVLKAVNLGDDSDTTGAVCGALAGIIYGREAIPREWLAALAAKEIIDGCLF
ncbi:MAG: ADP-ribosylglycohydrolase family protein [Dialister sp.]|nr:ADP-ribosylglycohydrolase family protein [Dialister sp.]